MVTGSVSRIFLRLGDIQFLIDIQYTHIHIIIMYMLYRVQNAISREGRYDYPSPPLDTPLMVTMHNAPICLHVFGACARTASNSVRFSFPFVGGHIFFFYFISESQRRGWRRCHKYNIIISHIIIITTTTTTTICACACGLNHVAPSRL